MIKARSQIGDARQMFFVNAGGFDTHQNQLSTHSMLVAHHQPQHPVFLDRHGRNRHAEQCHPFHGVGFWTLAGIERQAARITPGATTN